MAINEKIACWIKDGLNELTPDIPTWAPDSQITQSLLSKSTQAAIAQKVGMVTLPTYSIDRSGDAIATIPSTEYPLCLRPDAPGGASPAFKVRLVHSPDELRSFIAQMKRIDRALIAQPFMDLPNLVVHGSRTLSGETIGLQAFLVARKFQGVTLTLCPHSVDTRLYTMCRQFADLFNLTGCFHFEFLHDFRSGNTYFLEINCRLGGTTAKVCACGYDEPLIALAAYGVIGDFKPNLRQHTVSSKHALVKYAYYAVSKRLSPLDYPIETVRKRLLKILYAMLFYRDEVASLNDIRGTLAYYLSLLLSHRKKGNTHAPL